MPNPPKFDLKKPNDREHQLLTERVDEMLHLSAADTICRKEQTIAHY